MRVPRRGLQRDDQRGALRAIEEEVMNEWVKAIIAAAAGGVLTLLAALATGWFSIGCPPSSPIG
jgi:hypothetical protein